MDLPDFPAMSDSTQPDLGQLRHAATWAETFGPGDTNLAQRNRYAGNVEDYNQALQKAHEAEVMKNITTGKNAFNFWKATEQMAQKERMHKADMAVAAPLQQARMAAAEAAAEAHRVTSMHTAAAEARAAKQATDVANAQERFDSARHDAWTAFGPGSATPDMGRYHQAVMEADMATPAAPATFKGKHVAEAQKFFATQPEAQDTAGFEQHMGEIAARGVAPQSDEWNSAVSVGLATFPKVKPTVVSKYSPANMPSPLKAENLQARTLSTQAGTEAKIAGVDIAKAREARIQSQFDRKLSDADTAKEDTSAFLSDAARLHEKVEQGTPEYRNGMADLVAAYPAASPAKVKAFMGLAGIADTEAQALRVRAQDFREKMALRSADRQDAVLTDREKAQSSKETLSANELALHQRSQSFREAQGGENAAAKEKAALEKEIAAIEKKRAPWKGTTGVFKDKNGVERFGFPAGDALGDKNKVPAEESLPATPELKADYQRYQNLILKRAAQSAGVTIKKFNPETGKIE